MVIWQKITPTLLWIGEKISVGIRLLLEKVSAIRSPVSLPADIPEENSSSSARVHAAMRIQRAYRVNQYKKQAKKINKKAFTEESLQEYLGDDLYRECKTLNITANPPIPSETKDINPEKAKEWIAANPENLQAMAKIVIKRIKKISFPKFLNQLHRTVFEFNKKLMQLPEENRQYFILLGQGGKVHKSNSWVLSWAFQSLIKSPAAVITTNDMSNRSAPRLFAAMQKYPLAKMALYLDDSIYSGTQIAENLHELLMNGRFDALLTKSNFMIYVGAPYITHSESTHKAITTHSSRGNIVILPHVPMLLLKEQLTKKEKEEYKKVEDLLERNNKRKTYTYFAHKTADFFSLPPVMRWGATLDSVNGLSEKTIPFVPEIKPPYLGSGSL